MKVLVIGTGFGETVVAPGYQNLGCEVTVVSPRDGEAVRKACRAGVDLVSVHSPPFMHREHVLFALEQGCAVLCDKPFGVSTGDARDMYDAAREKGTPNFLNFEFRCRSSNLKVKELVDSGAIGRLQHGSWQSFTPPLRDRPYGWLFDASLGGGWLGAYGSHLVDTILCLSNSRVIQCGGSELHQSVTAQGSRRAAANLHSGRCGQFSTHAGKRFYRDGRYQCGSAGLSRPRDDFDWQRRCYRAL